MRKQKQTQAERIVSYIRRRPRSGATRRELVQALSIMHQSVGPRVVELLNAGLVKETGAYRDGCRVLASTRGSR
jgi:predicted transcriptional regulator